MNTKRTGIAIFVAAVAAASYATDATAAVKNWTGGTGNWSVGANWSGGTAPAINDTVHITPNDGVARTIAYNASSPAINALYIDLTGPGTTRTTFAMSAGNLISANGTFVGENGRATFNHSGGTFTETNPFLDIAVGQNAGSNGIYNLSGTGSLAVGRDLYVGNFGVGAFNQTGGAVTTGSRLIIGNTPTGVGSYTISGGAISTPTGVVVGASGVGTLSIPSGGTVSTNSLSINSSSAVNLNGGTLRFNTASGLNRLNYTAGTIQLAGNRTLDIDDTVTFLYGPFLAPPASITIPSGKGLRVEGNATQFQSNRTVTVDGGNLSSTNHVIGLFPSGGGSLNIVNGGTVTTSANVTLGDVSDSFGTAAVASGGNWSIGDSLIVGASGSGTLGIFPGGEVHVGATIAISELSTVNLSGGLLRFNAIGNLTRLSYSSGTIQLAGNRDNGSITIKTLFGESPTIPAGKALIVEGTTTLSKPLTIAGGVFKTNGLVVGGGNTLDFDRGVLELTGGTITFLDNLTIPTNGEFRAGGAHALRITGAAGSMITATGNLTLGSAAAVNGFGTQGTLNVGAHTVTLLDANDAVFDSLALARLGSGASPGAMSAANGLTLDFGGNVTGFGTVTTPNNVTKPLINNGHFTGNSAAQRITLPGYVKGAGTFDHVNFTGTFSPGLSPALATVGSITFAPTSALIMELGGTSRGGQYDAILASGALGLGGALNVTLIDGFTPSAGHSFDLFDWATLTGTFASLNLPALTGLAWDTSQLYTTGVLSVVAPEFLEADFDEDGDVDGADLVRWRNNFGADTTHVQGDADGDGDSDGADFLAWQRQLGSAAPAISGNVSVPEPATLMLVVVAAVGIRRISGQRRQELIGA